MSYKHDFLGELQAETANTKKILERVPTDKNDWKPHARSAKLGNLAIHIAELPGWINLVMTTKELDLSAREYKPKIATTSDELVSVLTKNSEKAKAALENATETDFEELWTLRNGEHIIFTLPRKSVLRGFALSHMIHHRAQLGVFLRLLDIPIPGIYGPTADEIAGN